MPAPPYDPTLKTLVEAEPESWPTLFGRPQAPTAVIDADIATVSGAADMVLLVSAAVPYLLHLEFVVGHDAATTPPRCHTLCWCATPCWRRVATCPCSAAWCCCGPKPIRSS